MVLELKQQLRLFPQLIMTPQLQQAIKLLQLSRLELITAINQEMETNPLLEAGETEEISQDSGDIIAGDESRKTDEVTLLEGEKKDFDWEGYLNDYYRSSGLGPYYEEREAPPIENISLKGTPLDSHLTWQLELSDLTEKEVKIGTLIIGNLDPDGYLRTTLSEIAKTSRTDEKSVERVLKKIQEFDPIGVASRDLRECLLLQARHLNIEDSLVGQIIKNHLYLLENKNYKTIANKLKVSVEDVVAATEVILQMDPKPGRPYGTEQSQYINPDIFVHNIEGEFVITLNEDGLPRLKISSFYREMLKGDNIHDEAKKYIQDKLQSAIWLIRSVHQRQRTIYRVTESIVKFQREFFEKGIEYLKPLVLRDVAEDVGMHESTISRVTANKYVYIPQGIFELKYFFNSPIQKTDGDLIASESVKEKIKEIIQSEDPKSPYSDEQIARKLKESRIDIARRTVAKYREAMGILSSNKRRKPGI